MNREELTKALTSTRAGLADKDIVEHSTSFVFTKGQVMTYNDAVSVRHPLDLEVEGAVTAAPVLSFLSRATGEDVSIEQKEKELLLKCGRAKAGIPMVADVPEHLTKLSIPKKGWSALPLGFIEAIRFCLFTASKDMSKPILTNLHIEGSSVESSDNYRITRAKMGKGKMDGGILIPAGAAKNLPGFAPIEIATTKTWAHFRNKDKAVLSCRLFSGEFPKLDKFLKPKGDEIQFPEKLKDVLERAGVFSVADFDTDREVTITVKKDKMSVRAEGADGWFEEKIRAKGINDLSFKIHPGFLSDILTHSVKATIGKNAIVFKDKNFTHVVSF